jgi:hypothetical protein
VPQKLIQANIGNGESFTRRVETPTPTDRTGLSKPPLEQRAKKRHQHRKQVKRQRQKKAAGRK